MLELEEGPRNTHLKQTTYFSFCSPKASISCLIVSLVFLLLFQLSPLAFPALSAASPSWVFFRERIMLSPNQTQMLTKLRDSVTFLPLKDRRFSDPPKAGHTWFLSSLNDTDDASEAEYLYFPSAASKGRLLCVLGRSARDGSQNSYALAWEESLPAGSELRTGLTFVSDTYYDYRNLWHGLTAMMPSARWYQRKGCATPERWVLYHRGELRQGMGTWVQKLMDATFGRRIDVDGLEGADEVPVCFQKAAVFRHGTGKMGPAQMKEVFDMFRCRARAYCNVSPLPENAQGGSPPRSPEISMTVLLRKGARAFKNESAVVGIFENACAATPFCRFTAVHADDLSFCEQVRLLSATDVFVSPHGAQLTNMIFMADGGSVMEFFPKGWLEQAGQGQFVFHWLAEWAGMKHRGAWRDPDGDDCPYPVSDPRCFLFYKDGTIGHNETHFAEWAREVLAQVRVGKKGASALGGARADACPCL